jgi:hypothetical protein
MLPTGFLAVAIGIGCFVLIAVISMRGPRRRRRRAPDGGAIFPIGEDDGDDFDGK